MDVPCMFSWFHKHFSTVSSRGMGSVHMHAPLIPVFLPQFMEPHLQFTVHLEFARYERPHIGYYILITGSLPCISFSIWKSFHTQRRSILFRLHALWSWPKLLEGWRIIQPSSLSQRSNELKTLTLLQGDWIYNRGDVGKKYPKLRELNLIFWPNFSDCIEISVVYRRCTPGHKYLWQVGCLRVSPEIHFFHEAEVWNGVILKGRWSKKM